MTIEKNYLIYPAFADPTQPYVSLPTIKGYLWQHESPVSILDWNIEGVDYLLKSYKEIVKKHQRKTEELSRLRKKNLKIESQLLKLKESSFTLKGKWKNLKKEKDFYNFENYQEARFEAESLLQMLSAIHYPFEFGFNKSGPMLSPWDTEAIEYYLNEKLSPLDEFYKEKLKKLSKNKIGYIGISLTFASQLSEVFYLCHLIRRYCPEAFIILGGAALHQIISNIPNEDRAYFFNFCDAICTYEGEECLKKLHQILPEYKKKNEIKLLKEIPNLLIFDNGECFQTEIRQFDLAQSAPPDYSDLDLNLYLSPTPTLLYAPTRGCYWNKCSFCYYGFSQAATHSYREKSALKAAEELMALAKKYKVQHFYISGDVLSPRFAVELANELYKKKRKILWSTDLRIEKYYTPERCQLLFNGGLRTVAFGVESGSNRMLCEVINKGTTKELVTEINANFYEAGIATAWMTFLHHPKEKIQDAFATLDWLGQERERISLFIIGEFGLTPGSKIYGEAKKFNLKNISYTKGDFFKLYPMFEDETKDSSTFYRDELGREIQELASFYELSHYPWAGAISTHHTLLYLVKYGQDFFRNPQSRSDFHFDIPKVNKGLHERVEMKLQKYLEKALKIKKGVAPHSFGSLLNYLSEK